MIKTLIKKLFHRAHLPVIEKEDSVVEASFFNVNGAELWVYARGESKANRFCFFFTRNPGLLRPGWPTDIKHI